MQLNPLLGGFSTFVFSEVTMWLWTVMATALIVASEDKSPAAKSSNSPIWSDSGRCGTNCLFSALSLLGAPISYAELAAQIDLDPVKGSTLADLQEAAELSGVEMTIRQVKPQELIDLPVPFVMHLELADVGGSGHFVAVFGVFDSGTGPTVRFIDGGSGSVTMRSLADMSPAVTGFVLVPDHTRAGFWDRLASVNLATLFCLAVLIALPFAVLDARRVLKAATMREGR